MTRRHPQSARGGHLAAPERPFRRAVQTYCACGEKKKTAAKRCVTCADKAIDNRNRSAYAAQRERTAARRNGGRNDDSEATS